MPDDHRYPTVFHPWSEDDREIAFMRRRFGDERFEAMSARMEQFNRALISKSIAWSTHRGSYRAKVTDLGAVTWEPTGGASLVQRAHDAAVSYL